MASNADVCAVGRDEDASKTRVSRKTPKGGVVVMSSQPGWQFVGNVPENYERYLVPSIFGPFATDLIDLAALQENERVLDIACGTRSEEHTSELQSHVNIVCRLLLE